MEIVHSGPEHLKKTHENFTEFFWPAVYCKILKLSQKKRRIPNNNVPQVFEFLTMFYMMDGTSFLMCVSFCILLTYFY